MEFYSYRLIINRINKNANGVVINITPKIANLGKTSNFSIKNQSIIAPKIYWQLYKKTTPKKLININFFLKTNVEFNK